MIYATLGLWLAVIVLLAWTIQRLWREMVQTSVLNYLFLPGTLVAQVGYVVALLLTGAKAGPVSLFGDDDAEKDDETPAQSNIPLFGTVLIGLLPMLAVGSALHVVVRGMGEPVLGGVSADYLSSELPHTLSAFWEQLRGLISIAEDTLIAMRRLDWNQWSSAAFAYLLIALSMRMAPVPRHVRGHLGAIAFLCGGAALAGTVLPTLSDNLATQWPILATVIGAQLLLLMFSVSVRGVVALLTAVGR